MKKTIEKYAEICYNVSNICGLSVFFPRRFILMKHIKTINKANLKESAQKGGCGKCQASCQSACKTSCTVANQKCER